MTLGQRIQKGRVRLGLYQEGLGERLGVSRQAVSRWEADGAVPDTDKLIALSRLFGVSLNSLLEVEEPKKASVSAEQTKHKQKRLWHTLSALFAAALVLSNVLLWLHVARLERLAAPAGLDVRGPLVSAFDFDLTATKTDVRFGLTLTPVWVTEDMEVSFTAVAMDGTAKTVAAEPVGGGNYAAQLTLPGITEAPITLSAAFADGTGTHVLALGRVSEYGLNGYSWDPLWKK